MAKFSLAVANKDDMLAMSLMEENKDKAPAEIKKLLYKTYPAQTPTEEKEHFFFIAEEMARVLKDITGDIGPLVEIKKASFEAKLHEPARSAAVDGVHTVEFPAATDALMNVFRPDSMIIKKGETVKWVNNDKVAHLFSSLQLLGKGKIFTPDILPGESWSFKFEEAGEYYLVCFIHKGMIAKVLVEE